MNEKQNQKPKNEIQVALLLTNGDDRAAQQLSWLIRGFFCNTCEAYLKGAPRRVEAMALVLRMLNSAHDNQSITFDEYQSINQEITNIEEQIYPGCSLI